MMQSVLIHQEFLEQVDNMIEILVFQILLEKRVGILGTCVSMM